MTKKKYDAFISYSHADCGNIAPVIQRAIENIGKPWFMVKRRLNVYRDQTNLAATGELWPSIKKSLLSSEYFILLASPNCSSSYWIKQEVIAWIGQKDILETKNKKILIIATEGNLVWNTEANDFDWNKTTCLPFSVSKIFDTEPLWIDLTSFVNESNKNIHDIYKSAGFRTAIVKIIGAISGKEPREIESDELKRVRQINLFVSFFLIALLGTAFFAYTLFYQKNIEMKISQSNTFFAQGNNLQQSDISKALMYYAYGFKSYPTKSNFDFLKSFYLKNILLYSRDSSSIDTINRFYSRMTFTESYSPIDSNMSRIGINLSFPKNKYFYFTTQGIYLYDLTSKKADSISFLNKILSEHVDNLFIRNPKLGFIVFNKPFQDTLVGTYDIETKEIIPVVYRYSSLDSGGALLYDGKKINSDLPFEIGSDENLNMALSENGRFLIIYDMGNMTYTIKKEISFILFDLVKHVFSEKILKLPQDEVYQNFENLQVSNDGVLCYVSLYTGGARGFTDNYIYNILTSSLEKIIDKNHTSYGMDLDNQISSFKWGNSHDYFIYGTYSGKLVVQNTIDYINQVVLNPDEFKHTITSIEISKNYIIAGTDVGILHFFRNELENNPFNEFKQRMGFDYITSLQLPARTPIVSLFDDTIHKSLLVEKSDNIFYKLNLSEFSNLPFNENIIIDNLIKRGIEDLSPNEKIKFGVK